MSLETPVFCDWLKLKMPAKLDAAPFERYIQCYRGQDGSDYGKSTDWVRPAWTEIRDPRQQDDQKRSDSTLVRVRWSGEHESLTVDGNLGRFGWRDNVWGTSVYASAWNFLDFLAAHHRLNIQANPDVRRVDLTANVAFRDARDAYAYIAWTQGVKVGRAQPRIHQTGTAWVTENWSAKVYDKLLDMRRHGLHELAEKLASQVGYLLRFELTLRTDELNRYGLDNLKSWKEKESAMNIIFTEKFKPLARGGAVVDEAVRDMPVRLSNAVEAWRNGRNFTAAVADGALSKRTYYRLRKELLTYGVDISQPCNVTRLNIKPREVPFSFVAAPEWYRQRAA